MSVPFETPDWLIPTDYPPPPDTSAVDPHRVEDLVNRFIAGKQDALFLAPDAYYRTAGADAVDGAPAILDRLNNLKQATLDAANDDGTRAVLAPRLDAHLDDARDGIDRHVAGQRDILTRQIIGERQRLIQRAATLEHTNDDKLAGLAEAHASAASELARMSGEPEAAAMDAARSAIWHTAIDQHLANGNGPQAIDLFDLMKDQIVPPDRHALDVPLQVARNDHAAYQWIVGQIGTDGPPLQDRTDADPSLSPDTRLIVRAKLDAQDSSAESSRAATVKNLDEQIADAIRVLATKPNDYKPGTLAQLALAYEDTRAPDKAVTAHRLATQEAFLVPFSQMSVDRQQRLVDSLPDGGLRNVAIDILRHQTEPGPGSSGAIDPNIVLVQEHPDDEDPVYEWKREQHRETPDEDIRHGQPATKQILPPPPLGFPGPRVPPAAAKTGSNSVPKSPTNLPIPAGDPEYGGQGSNADRPADAAPFAKSAREKIEATWGKLNTLKRHFDDHGADFNATDQMDYARKAHEFLQRAQWENLPRKIDDQGVSRIYDPATNTFGVYNPDGTTRTFYTPNPAVHRLPTNIDYWNSQPGH